MLAPQRKVSPLAIFSAITAIAITLIVSMFIKVYRVSGDSMVPTFADRQVIALKKVPIAEGALIVFEAPEDWSSFTKISEKSLLKRVVAVPGDLVSLEGEGLYVNGQEIAVYQGCKGEDLEMTVSGGVIVLGDNRNNSTDSLLMMCNGLTPIVPFDRIEFTGEELF